MAKRFIDTQIFRKPFIKGLASHHKLLWFYLLAECDHAGIWQVELDVASMRLGQDYDEQECLQAFGDKIQPICGGTKWFIPDFLTYQYGEELNPKVKLHASAIAILQKYGLHFAVKATVSEQLANCCQTVPQTLPVTVPVTVKDKYKDKEKEIEEGVQGEPSTVTASQPASVAINPLAAQAADIVALYRPIRQSHEFEAQQIVFGLLSEGEDPVAIKAGLLAIREQVAKWSPAYRDRYAPTSATFFRNRRWLDDPGSWVEKSAKAQESQNAPKQSGKPGGGKLAEPPNWRAIWSVIYPGETAPAKPWEQLSPYERQDVHRHLNAPKAATA